MVLLHTLTPYPILLLMKKIYKIKATDRVTLKKTQWLVVASRYNVFLINQNGLILNRGNGKLTFDPLSINPNTIKIFNKLKKKKTSQIFLIV